MKQELCPQHSGLEARIENLEKRADKLSEKLNTLIFLVVALVIEIPVVVLL